jgi:hypothetical protein
VGADLGEATLRGLGEAIEDRTRDGELEDAVAQELEALVRIRAVFCPRGVLEDLLLPGCRELRDQAAELLGPGGLRLSLGAR